ncbi:MAG: winged helix-turn-helix domain-containing protein, partial [Acidobacteriota bacterium]
MDDETGVRQNLQVGEARVRMTERTIEVGGELRQVDHKALRVLRCLLERPGTVVTKRELLDHVWSGSFVTDDVLTAAISRLRRAFGDASRTPHTIETVPSVGYRLIAPVRSLSADPARRRRRRLASGMVVVVLAVVALLLTVDRVGRPSAESTSRRSLAVLPLENLTGDSDQAHLAAGMTEAWITGLARQPGWRAAFGASVRRYAEARPPLAEVADALDVDVLVEGALQRSGDHLRVSARLVAADDLRLLWAGTFDGSADEVFDLQERAVAVMARQLGPGDA